MTGTNQWKSLVMSDI